MFELLKGIYSGWWSRYVKVLTTYTWDSEKEGKEEKETGLGKKDKPSYCCMSLFSHSNHKNGEIILPSTIQ